jgi:hypothetical protein
VHFRCCVIDGVFATGQEGQVEVAVAEALTREDRAAMRQNSTAALDRTWPPQTTNLCSK